MRRVIPCIQVTKLIRRSEDLRFISRDFFPVIIYFNKNHSNRGNWFPENIVVEIGVR